jgi:hypothetical protein
VNRNVWKLSRVDGGGERSGEVSSFGSFNDGRRRFG